MSKTNPLAQAFIVAGSFTIMQRSSGDTYVCGSAVVKIFMLIKILDW